jgi:hypothetical protein
MSNWTSAFLSDKFAEGEKLASMELKTLLARTSLSVKSGKKTYELPDECIGISRVTYRGAKLQAITFNEITQSYRPVLYGTGGEDGAFDSDGFSNSAFSIDIMAQGMTPTGRPQYFIYDTLGFKNITLFPIPSETLASTTDNLYLGTTILERCIVEYVRLSDSTVTLPSYIRNPMCKYYTLAKAFEVEGKGQDLSAAALYMELFNYFLGKAKRLLGSQFQAHIHELDPMEVKQSLIGRVRLPWNYGTVVK